MKIYVDQINSKSIVFIMISLCNSKIYFLFKKHHSTQQNIVNSI